MLVIDIKINESLIDTIMVHRIKNAKTGYNTYKVVKPEGFGNIIIRHHYDDGYFTLMTEIMTQLRANGYNPNPEYTWKQVLEFRKILEKERKSTKRTHK